MMQPSSLPPEPPVIGLVIIGDEILSGKRQDKHMLKVIELLAARGLQLAWAEYVGDVPQRITATLRRAFASGDLVFSCGGIGATPDDHTRRCAAEALGVGLELHPQAAALIRERMQDVAREQGLPYEPERPDNIHRLNMGVFPQGARLIPNPYNKIPGFSVGHVRSGAGPSQAVSAPSGGSDPHAVGERGGQLSGAGPSQAASVHFLPGFPVMAWPMIEWVLDQHYAHLFRDRAYAEKSVIVFGAMEASLTPLMEQVERDHPGVKVFSLPSVDHPLYGRHIDLGVKGAPELVDGAYAQLRAGLTLANASLGPELVR